MAWNGFGVSAYNGVESVVRSSDIASSTATGCGTSSNMAPRFLFFYMVLISHLESVAGA